MNNSEANPTDPKYHPTHINHTMERYRKLLSEKDFQTLLMELEQPLTPAIRPNLLKVSPEIAMKKWVDHYGWQIKRVPFSNTGWQVLDAEVSISRTIEHQMGEYYIQDAASLLPVNLLSKPDNSPKLILDMAAAPGGKTTQLIDRYSDKSLVLANDSSASRLQSLRVVLENWGSINHVITHFPGEQISNWFPDCFDVILLDAPCSMENLRPSRSHPAKDTSESERLRLQSRQMQLIESAFQALKPGGELIYATCSLAPEEDEAVIDFLLSQYPQEAVIDECPEFNITAPGLDSFEEVTFQPSVKNAFRLWPHIANTSGFFSAKILKTASVSSSTQTIPERSFTKTGLKSIPQDTQGLIVSQMSDDFGLDIDKILDDYQCALFFRDISVFLIPLSYLSKFDQLPYYQLGFFMGKLIKNEFLPSHEFFNRFGYQFTNGIVHLPDEVVPQWMSGQDLRNWEIKEPVHSKMALIMDEFGRNLGGGKILPKRLRNLLPSYTLLTN